MSHRSCSLTFRVIGMLGILLDASGQERSASPFTFQNGRLTASVQNVPIREFLEELALQTKVAIFPPEQIDGLISVDIKDKRLEDAIYAILPAHDSFFYYQAGDAAALSLRSVWIYPKGAGVGMRPAPFEVWAVRKELVSSLADKDPQVRARAHEALLDRPGGDSRELLLSALRGGETDESVRQRIFSGAVSKGIELPADVLGDLARDPSEGMRWMALDALWQQGSGKEVAETLSTDPSEAVRQKAAEVLGDLKAAASRREAAARSPDSQP